MTEGEATSIERYRREAGHWEQAAHRQLPQYAVPDDYVLIINRRVNLTRRQAAAMEQALEEVTRNYLPEALEHLRDETGRRTAMINAAINLAPPTGADAVGEIVRGICTVQRRVTYTAKGQGNNDETPEQADQSRRTALATLASICRNANDVTKPDERAAAQMSALSKAIRICRNAAAAYRANAPADGCEALALRCISDAQILTRAVPEALLSAETRQTLEEMDRHAVQYLS
jgi:hypothetical protein